MLAVAIFAAISACVADPWVKLQRTPLIHKKPGLGNIDTTLTRTVYDCVRKCSGHDECRSVFYVHGTGECQKHSVVYTPASPGLIDTVSTVYYEKATFTSTTTDAQTTTSTTTPGTTTTKTTTTTATTTTTMPTSTAPACVPSPFVCPEQNETNFIQYCDQTFSFRLYFDMQRNFSAAKAECESHGGHLFEILTVAKMNFARQLVLCSDYSSSYVWIDGEYNGATFAFETSDGVPLPLTQGTFFYTNRPNSPGVGQCVWIDPSMTHLLDDAGCSALAYMICEKP